MMTTPDNLQENTEVKNEPILLTVKQVAKLIGMSERSIWRLSGSGEFPAPIALGRSKRWYRKSVDDFAEANAHKANDQRS